MEDWNNLGPGKLAAIALFLAFVTALCIAIIKDAIKND